MIQDPFTKSHEDLLDGAYDCVDRIVVNAYFGMGHSPRGFRAWWRQLTGGDETLDNYHLMRFAGRFSRRVRAYAKKSGIPLLDAQAGDRKYEMAEPHRPADPTFRGVYCIVCGRVPGVVYDVKRCSNGQPHLTRKTPYVNHYSFYIMDPQWGSMAVKLCPHPPFAAQIVLNGHEYVARAAEKAGLRFAKEGNCFTDVSDAAGLAAVAETMSAPGAGGRLREVCERWIYSACLIFALDRDEQERSWFRYSYSVHQAEYSRNLLFQVGRALEQVFQGTIDRTRSSLQVKTLKTIFGYKHRPSRRSKSSRCEVVIERPVYDLTVFKIHFGKLTLKIYCKGERVLRIEAIAHNTRDLGCGRIVERFDKMVEALREMVERFLAALQSIDASLVDLGVVEAWPTASTVGATRVGGVNVHSRRMRAVMETVIALSVLPQGFTAAQAAKRIREILGIAEDQYRTRHASYDLKKLRGKDLIARVGRTHQYVATETGLRTMTGYLVLQEKVLKPLLANPGQPNPAPTPRSPVDQRCQNIQSEMKHLFKHIGIAA